MDITTDGKHKHVRYGASHNFETVESNLLISYSDYIAFVDESGDHCIQPVDLDYPVFVLSICLFRKDVYVHQLTPAIRNLKNEVFGHDLVVLHESDIRRRRKVFAQISKEPRASFVAKLTSIISSTDFSIVGVAIDKHKQSAESPIHPYHSALTCGLERLHQILCEEGQENARTVVVFESRGPKEDCELDLEFHRACSGENRFEKRLLFDLVIADKKANCEGLQIADLTARPMGLSVIRPQQPNRAFDVVRTKLRDIPEDQSSIQGLTILPMEIAHTQKAKGPSL